MRKRFLALLLALGLTLTGTAVTTESAYAKDTSVETTDDIHTQAKEFADSDSGTMSANVGSTNSKKGDSYWDQFSGHTYYDKLNSNQKKLYDKLKTLSDKYLTGTTSAKSRTLSDGTNGYYTSTITYSGMTAQQAFNVATIFCFENPQYYFLNGGIGYTEPIDSYVWDIHEPGTVSLGVYSRYASGSKRASFTSQFRNIVNSYISGASSYSSDLARETYFHDRLASEVAYNEYTDDYNEDSTESQSASSAFFFKNTVCAGYSKAFSLLLNSQGIENVAVTSDSHAWNEVRINGTWYITDVTWDENGWPTHDFFNISESEMGAMDKQWAHSPLSFYSSLRPSCTTRHTSSVDAVNLGSVSQQTDNNTSQNDNSGNSSSQNDTDNRQTSDVVIPQPQQISTATPAKPSTFTVKRTNKRGTVRITIRTKTPVKAFVVKYTGTNFTGTNYVEVNGKSATFTIGGLTKGRTYSFTARSVGDNGKMSKSTRTRKIKA